MNYETPDYLLTFYRDKLRLLAEDHMQTYSLTREELAKKTGITSASMSYIMSGKNFLRLSTLIKFGLALGVVVEITFTPTAEYLKRFKDESGK